MALELPRGDVARCGVRGAPGPGQERAVGGLRATRRSERVTVATSEPAQKCRDLLQQAGAGYCVSVGAAGSSLAFLASYASRISLAKNLENASDVPARILLSLLASAFKN